MRNPYLISSKK